MAVKYKKILYKVTCHKCGKRNWSENEGPMPDCTDCGAKLEKYKTGAKFKHISEYKNENLSVDDFDFGGTKS